MYNVNGDKNSEKMENGHKKMFFICWFDKSLSVGVKYSLNVHLKNIKLHRQSG